MLVEINFKVDMTYKKFDIKIKKNIKNLILHNMDLLVKLYI